MSYYGFSAARYLRGKQAAHATKGQGIAQLGQAIGQATQTVSEAVAQEKKAEQLLKENKEYFDQSYNATYRLYKDKLIEVGVPETQADKIIQTHLTPITPMEYKNPKIYIETKSQQTKQLDNYIAKLEGQETMQATQRAMKGQVLGQPQQVTPMGEPEGAGFTEQNIRELGAPQSEEQLRSVMMQNPTGTQLSPGQIEAGIKMAGLPKQTDLMRETRLAQGEARQQQQQQLRIEKFEQEKKVFEQTQSRMAKVEARQAAQMAVNYFKNNPTPAVAEARLNKVNGIIKDLEAQINNAKEQKANEVAAKLKGSLEYYKDIQKRSEESLKNSQKMAMYLQGSSVGGGGAAPPAGTGESTFMMDGVEYQY